MDAVANRMERLTDVASAKKQKFEEILKPLYLGEDKIKRLMDVMEEQMKLATSKDENTRKKSDILMAVTHVRCLLQGGENGDYLGLDLGGTNFRVVRVQLKDGMASTTTKYYTLTEQVLSGPCAGVFDFIAESIKDFLQQENLINSDSKIPLGFTFSFPSTQLALNSAILLTWTKSFKCPDGVGSDSVQLLEQAIARKAPGLPVDIVAVMSDTTSTLMAGNYLDKKCRIGVILGTGSNAAFVEHLENIEKYGGDFKEPKQVLVNVEWGCMGDSGCLDFYKTEFEKEIDQHSNHVNSFTFEKSFAGMYLGEFVRLVLVKLTNEGVLFNGHVTEELATRWKFTSGFVTKIDSDKDKETTNTRNILEKLNLSTASDEDIAIVREVCDFVVQRASYIVAAALAVLIRHVNLPEVTVAIDGSLYEHHPKFHNYMMELISQLNLHTQVKLILAKDGSGQGAAFAAVAALRQIEENIVSA
ncbi:hypothetical protein LOTGIDRAFT_233221 [Lottia gigantea]|uniref:Phosphotransferase n=1 Tax=Lottia gigantea TaxID=225164 RepID=V4AFM2_LOTGI|nr:hypothetical protein LOTGIDRAFT_233221 [Lottia gigantea]ESO92176.1 hypothetical protein LOTGIDRAFT_233221 [Lottia gigantea]